MNYYLVVGRPFGPYVTGATITDPVQIAQIEAVYGAPYVYQVTPGATGPTSSPGSLVQAVQGVTDVSAFLASFTSRSANLSDIPDKAAARSNLGVASVGHTPVYDADYPVVPSDVDVEFVTLAAARVVTLCDVDTYPFGQDLVIGDGTGLCSPTLTITIVIGSGTNDTIPQTSDNTIVLNTPLAFVRLRRGTANIWKIV